MHVGYNMLTKYYLKIGHKDNELQVIEEERDLGVVACKMN